MKEKIFQNLIQIIDERISNAKIAMDVVQESANTTNIETKIEAFSIAMYEASSKVVPIKVGWEYTIVEFPVTLL